MGILNDVKCNYDAIQSMSLNELSEWVAAAIDFNVADEWFDRTYCSKCDRIKVDNEEGKPISLAYCECEKKCRFFPEDNVLATDFVINRWMKVPFEYEKTIDGNIIKKEEYR